MSRFLLVSSLSKNTMVALSANASCYSTTTKNVIDKTKNALPPAATATKQAMTSAKEKGADVFISKQRSNSAVSKTAEAIASGGGGDPAGNCGFVDNDVIRTDPNSFRAVPQTGSTTPAHHR